MVASDVCALVKERYGHHFDLYRVSDDKLELEKIPGGSLVATYASDTLSAFRRIKGDTVNLAILESSTPLKPTGIVYKMPIGHMTLKKSSPFYAGTYAQKFLGKNFSEVGVISLAGKPTTNEYWSDFDRIKCVYVIVRRF